MSSKIYLETSVISYLCARPSRDLVVAAAQEVTHEWWNTRRLNSDCYVSEFIIDEISDGDPSAAALRLALVKDLPILSVNDKARELASRIMIEVRIPASVSSDIVHVAVAVVHEMDYLLTWNCVHIANPYWQRRLTAVVQASGYVVPAMCTPQAMLEGEE